MDTDVKPVTLLPWWIGEAVLVAHFGVKVKYGLFFFQIKIKCKTFSMTIIEAL